jgi:superfamily II DNA or RNA helicase
MTYTEKDILLHVGPRALEAGRIYQRQRRVAQFDHRGDALCARVQGNVSRPYQLEIRIGRNAAGQTVIESECTCPVGCNCKHVAAALFEGLARAAAPSIDGFARHLPPSAAPARAPSSPPPLPAGELPAPLALWLDALEQARSRDEEDYPDESRQRIVYVLAPEGNRRGVPALDLKILTTRLLKDGALSSGARAFEPKTALTSTSPAKFLRPSDFRIFRKIMLARNDHISWTFASPLAKDGGFDLLADILATDRARWLEVNGPALKLGPLRQGKIQWDVVNGEEMRLRLELGEGIVALNAAPPVYVDPKAGLIGPIDIGLSPTLARTLVAAPPAPIVHAALLSESMALRAPEIAVLRPPPPATPVRHATPPQIVLRLVREDLPIEDGQDQRYRYYGYQAPTESIGVARLVFRYGPVDVERGEPKSVLIRYHDGGLVEIHRDARVEAAAVAEMETAGFVSLDKVRMSAPARRAQDFLPEDGGEFAWFDAIYRDLPRLRERGWIIEVAPDFPVRLIGGDGDIDASLRESSGIDWLELDLGVVIDGETIDLVAPIVALIGTRSFDPGVLHQGAFGGSEGYGEPFYLPLPDGRFLAMPAARLAPIVAAVYELACGGALTDRNGRLRLGMADAAGMADFERTTLAAGLVWRGGEKLREMGRKLAALGGLPRVELPHTFKARLRPYQEQGVAWLAFLRDVGLGGVLADDMGLGKTVQALALIAIEKAAGRLNAPALVVAPTSLMANWRREAEKFVPDLRVLTLQGDDRRKRFDSIEGSDLVLTTYPLVARDHDVLSARQWHVLLLDEAQTIKNPNAATTKLIRGLQANHRFCLTGTPLENHLGELWSIFSFASPGFLGDLASFTQSFRTPIEKKGDSARGRLLARRVKPFLLRRTKGEVASDLPAKTEIVERIEMAAAQRDIYESIRISMHERVRAAIAEKGFARSRIVILDALLKLRQSCCDPRLLKLSIRTSAKAGSAKLDRLTEMLDALLDEGRRILVFSQFTSMLDLIRPRLDEMRVSYSLLTGDTRDRESAIGDFQDGKTKVFLISLKAGGVGLNLTSADTVILYDPWWNPAVEEQAIDRAHRIGQDKPVFVHKLVMSGTIEEKMEALKEKKRALAESLFDHDGAPTLAMSEADLDMLFAAE